MRVTRYLGAWGAVAAVICLAGAIAVGQEGAPTQKQLDIAALRAQRKAVVGANMKLTPEQAKVFWPA